MIECHFTADRLGLARRHQRTLVAAVRGVVQPGALIRAELFDQPRAVHLRELANSPDAERFEARVRFGADAIDFAHSQWPDPAHNVVVSQQRQPIGLVQLRRDLREQLVAGDRDRARQAGCRAHGPLNRLPNVAGTKPSIVFRLGHSAHRGRRPDVGQVDVDFIDAAVLDLGRNCPHGGLEHMRIAPIRVEVDRQQNRFRRERRRFHQSHRRMQAERACFVGCRRNDASTCVVGERRECARPLSGCGID